MLKLTEQHRGPISLTNAFSRRSLLNIGSLTALGTAGGFTLPSILRAEDIAGKTSNTKSVIMIYLVVVHRIKICSI